MPSTNHKAIASLAAAGVIWGLTVPLSKLTLGAVAPAWLAVIRFVLAAPLLAILGRHRLRQALTPAIAWSGALGFGAVIFLQNAGVARTSVSHSAVLVGTVPVLVAVAGTGNGPGRTTPRIWAGYLVALFGVALVAGGGGSHASVAGDLLVLAAAALSAVFIARQPRHLDGRDPAAVTAVQFASGALVSLPIAVLTEGVPAIHHPESLYPLLALALPGTLLPFWLFAFGQARTSPAMAGAFVNLEPLVGAAAGWLAFGDPAGPSQLAGAAAVVIGIAVSAVPAGALPVPGRLRDALPRAQLASSRG